MHERKPDPICSLQNPGEVMTGKALFCGQAIAEKYDNADLKGMTGPWKGSGVTFVLDAYIMGARKRCSFFSYNSINVSASDIWDVMESVFN